MRLLLLLFGLLTAVLGFAAPTQAQPARTDPMIGTVMNSYGLPGAVDTPTAEMLPDATLGATLSYSDDLREGVGAALEKRAPVYNKKPS